jgi:transposase
MAESNRQRSQRRAVEGLTAETQVPKDVFEADPSHGGIGYPLWYRLHCLDRVAAIGLDETVQEQKPSRKTLTNWMARVHPYERKGGHQRQLVGQDQLLMVIYLTAYPDAELEELAAYIVNNGGELHSTSTICRRLKELKLTRKKASIEAYQAFHPRNILRRDQFFGLPPPLGVNGIERRRLIDADECAVSIDQTNRRFGRAHSTIRVRKPGHYTKGKKLTIILFFEPGDPTLPANVDGSIENPRRWFFTFEDGGMTSEIFSEKVDTVLQSLEASNRPVDQHRILMWDNLRSHLTNQVYQTVYTRQSPNRFDMVPCPPYMPKYGPTEYAFAELGFRKPIGRSTTYSNTSTPYSVRSDETAASICFTNIVDTSTILVSTCTLSVLCSFLV